MVVETECFLEDYLEKNNIKEGKVKGTKENPVDVMFLHDNGKHFYTDPHLITRIVGFINNARVEDYALYGKPMIRPIVITEGGYLVKAKTIHVVPVAIPSKGSFINGKIMYFNEGKCEYDRLRPKCTSLCSEWGRCRPYDEYELEAKCPYPYVYDMSGVYDVNIDKEAALVNTPFGSEVSMDILL